MADWQPIETAPKDGNYIVAIYRSLDGYAEQLDGRAFVVRHEGETASGYDLGWALFPGHGGVPDKCLSCWQPLPAPPAKAMSARQSQDPKGLGPQDASAVPERNLP